MCFSLHIEFKCFTVNKSSGLLWQSFVIASLAIQFLEKLNASVEYPTYHCRRTNISYLYLSSAYLGVHRQKRPASVPAMIHLVTHKPWRNLNWFATIEFSAWTNANTPNFQRILASRSNLAASMRNEIIPNGCGFGCQKTSSARYNELVEPSTKLRTYSSFKHFSFCSLSVFDGVSQQKLLSGTKVVEKSREIFLRPTH